MLTLEPFRAPEPLLRIMRHPDVWPWIADEGCDPDLLCVDRFIDCEDMLATCIDGVPIGFAFFEARSLAMSEFHGGVFPEFRGAIALRLARMAVARFWEGGRDKLVALCPSGNRAAARTNVALGFVREGVITNAYRRGGRLEDLIVFGMSRGEA